MDNISTLRALLGLAALGCMQNRVAATPLSPLVEERVMRSPDDTSAVSSSFTVEGTLVRGHLAWARTCRRVSVVRERTRRVTRREPNREGALVAGVGGLIIGTTGGALATHLDQFSDEERCELDADGNEQCSSPRGEATLGSGLLIGTAAALVVGSFVTLASKPRVAGSEVSVGPPGTPRTLASGVPCGQGSLPGLGVSAYRAEERVAASATDADGNVTLRVPENVTGPLTLVVDSVPPRYALIVPGQALAELTLAPDTAAPSW